jgi:hypothetical protein
MSVVCVAFGFSSFNYTFAMMREKRKCYYKNSSRYRTILEHDIISPEVSRGGSMRIYSKSTLSI